MNRKREILSNVSVVESAVTLLKIALNNANNRNVCIAWVTITITTAIHELVSNAINWAISLKNVVQLGWNVANAEKKVMHRSTVELLSFWTIRELNQIINFVTNSQGMTWREFAVWLAVETPMVTSTAISIIVLTPNLLHMRPIIRPQIRGVKIILHLKTWRSINILIWILNMVESMKEIIEVMIEVTTGGSMIVIKATSTWNLREAVIPIRENKNLIRPITIITTSNITSDMITTLIRRSISDTNTVAADGDIHKVERGINFIKWHFYAGMQGTIKTFHPWSCDMSHVPIIYSLGSVWGSCEGCYCLLLWGSSW